MRRLVPAFAVLSCLLAARPAAANGEEPFDALYARLTKAREILGVAMSPDGSHVARVEPVRNEKTPRASRILVQDGAGIVNWQSYYGQKRIDRWLK